MRLIEINYKDMSQSLLLRENLDRRERQRFIYYSQEYTLFHQQDYFLTSTRFKPICLSTFTATSVSFTRGYRRKVYISIAILTQLRPLRSQFEPSSSLHKRTKNTRDQFTQSPIAPILFDPSIPSEYYSNFIWETCQFYFVFSFKLQKIYKKRRTFSRTKIFRSSHQEKEEEKNLFLKNDTCHKFLEFYPSV